MTATTKTKAKTKTTKKTPATALYTTFRMIEGRACSDEYLPFLMDFGGHPIDPERFDLDEPALARKFRQPARTGPDDHILLSDIERLSSRRTCMSGKSRVYWLMEHGCIAPKAELARIKREEKAKQYLKDKFEALDQLSLIDTIIEVCSPQVIAAILKEGNRLT